MNRFAFSECFLIFAMLAMGGCITWPSPPPVSQPYFSVDTPDAKTIHALAKKQDAFVAKCTEHSNCDHAYFTRGLIGLYESRETAIKYFEKVLGVAPKSQLAVSSKLWLRLLQQYPSPSDQPWLTSVIQGPAISDSEAILGQATSCLVRELLEIEMTTQQTKTTREADVKTIESLQQEIAERDRKIDVLIGKREQGKGSGDAVSVQSLQKQVMERDKRIEELTGQLEALKRIDQEMREKVRPIRPPSTVMPPAVHEGPNP
ncbi:hypothetical protein [Petrachloros mirabilis]